MSLITMFKPQACDMIKVVQYVQCLASCKLVYCLQTRKGFQSKRIRTNEQLEKYLDIDILSRGKCSHVEHSTSKDSVIFLSSDSHENNKKPTLHKTPPLPLGPNRLQAVPNRSSKLETPEQMVLVFKCLPIENAPL